MPSNPERRMAPRTNHVLAARVAPELDQSVEHSHGIQVFAENDRVTLRGVALYEELSDVVKAVQNVKGVKVLTNDLELRANPGKVFALKR
jgi:osmotically-inducible protein OsmY